MTGTRNIRTVDPADGWDIIANWNRQSRCPPKPFTSRNLESKLSTDQKNEACIFEGLIDRLPADKFAKPQLQSDVEPNIDLPAAMKQALANPTYYPPIQESVFPGDSIAIVLQSDLPHARSVLEALIEQLSSASIEPSDITVVVTRRTADQLEIDPRRYENPDEQKLEGKRPAAFPVEFGFNTINFLVHDTENESGMSYLAANAEGDPIHVNRTLVDADVVLPIGCPTAGDMDQQTNCIYPDFANSTIKHRFAEGKGSFISRWQEIELANDTLGSFFTIQIACGPGDSIRQLFCGARKDATDLARAATNELWAFDWSGDSEITVATIETNATDQDWDDFANALITASRLTNSEGPIVIWSEIGVNPDRKIRKACMSQFEDGISTKLTKTMQHVAAIVNERPVFLKSRLPRNSVEELGIGFVESVEEVIRIAEPAENGLLIRDAHKCQLKNRDSSTDGESE